MTASGTSSAATPSIPAAVACGILALGLVALTPSGNIFVLIAVIVAGAVALSTLGGRLPVLRRLGGETLATLLVPSLLVYLGVFNSDDVAAITRFFERSHMFEAFLTVAIAGSLISTDRQLLARSFLLLLPILVVSSVAVLAGGLAAEMLLGQDLKARLLDTLFPMLSGGLSAGLVPLSVGYASAFGIPAATVMATILPALLLSNIAMIFVAGALSARGARPGSAKLRTPDRQRPRPGDVIPAAIGVAVIFVLFAMAVVIARGIGASPTLAVIVLSVGIAFSGPLPERLRSSVGTLYRLVIENLTLPLIFAVGLAYMPLEQLVAGLEPARLAVIATALASLCAAAWATAKRTGQDPAEITALFSTRVAMGGTGAMAILRAAGRMDLVAQAQIIVRLGGIAAVTVALLVA